MSAPHVVLGLRLDALTMADLHERTLEAIAKGNRIIIGSHNLHSAYLYHRNARLRDFYALADYARIDGMALVFLGRLLGHPLRRHHRVTYVDWLGPFLSAMAKNNCRVFYLGSTQSVADCGVARLRREFPDLKLGFAHGYFDAQPGSRENELVLQTINAFQPHVLLVGMGMPRQQLWILENEAKLQTNVISNCGAVLDYVAGAIPTPPRWMGQLGLEWLFRLAAEPRRLGRRYLLEPWYLLPIFLRELVALRLGHPLARAIGRR